MVEQYRRIRRIRKGLQPIKDYEDYRGVYLFYGVIIGVISSLMISLFM